MEAKSKGRFIVVDGPDGAGKTTVIERMRHQLAAEGVPVLISREPGGSPYAEDIRNVILSNAAESAEVLTMLYLFNAARFERMAKIIRPTLAKGVHVISDRFDSTTYAYQVVAEERLDLASLFAILRMQYSATLPYYIMLDVTPEVGRVRMQDRGKQNHYDLRSPQWHERARAGFKDFLAGFCTPQTHTIVSAGREPDEVFAEVLQITRGLL